MLVNTGLAGLLPLLGWWFAIDIVAIAIAVIVVAVIIVVRSHLGSSRLLHDLLA